MSKQEKIQTLEQAKAKLKKTLLLIGIVPLLLAVIGFILHVFIGLFIVVAAIGIEGFVYFSEMQKYKRNFCPSCGTRYDYDDDISWEIVESKVVDVATDPNKHSKQMCGKRMDTYEFKCTCSSCKNVTGFVESFPSGYVYTDGSVKKISSNAVAKKYFKI